MTRRPNLAPQVFFVLTWVYSGLFNDFVLKKVLCVTPPRIDPQAYVSDSRAIAVLTP